MDDEEKSPAPSRVIDLSAVRREMRDPTELAVIIAERAGAVVEHVRPGEVRVRLGDPSERSFRTEVVINVRPINVFELEAEAYRRAGQPVPDRVLSDLNAWNKKHGR